MTLYKLTITVRSPLHIGSGGPPLRDTIDFMKVGSKFTHVLDQQAVFDHILPETADAELIEKITSSQNLASFLKDSDLKEQPQLTRYRMGGTPRVGELRPQLKNGFGQLYLPGSTLKGAIRTALVTALAERSAIQLSRLGPRREWAARDVENDLVSRAPRPAQTPNYDLLRTIQVADSAPLDPGDRLALENVAVWPAGQRGIPIDIETIRAQTPFEARLKLDEYLLGPAAGELDFGRGVEHVRNWLGVCREHGLARMAAEAQFFEQRGAARVVQFYNTLLAEAEASAPTTFYTQLGWGTGWHSKTLSRVITPDSRLLTTIIERYRLSQGRYQQGTPFPKTRHVTTDNQRQPIEPLGWVKVVVS